MAKSESPRFELRGLPDLRQHLGGLEVKRLGHISVLCWRSLSRRRGCRDTCVLRSPPHPWLRTEATQEASESLHAQGAPSTITSEFTEDTG